MSHNSPEIKEFIQDHSSLFWYIKPESKQNISNEFLVETILNYGNEDSVKRLFELLGLDTVSEIFYKQTSGKRTNYFPRTAHFFNLYFKRHVH